MEANAPNDKPVRLKIKKDVLIDNSIQGYTLEISEEDMLISSQVPLPVGMSISVMFDSAEGLPPIKLQARVKSLQEGVGIGLVFTNVSPAAKERLKQFIEESVHPHPVAHEAPSHDTRKKILLVDDSPAARATYKSKLVLSSYSVKEAANGLEAIKAMTDEKPDLVLLDMQMEGMDGTKFLHFMRTNDAWKDVKVIVLSGRITADEANKISSFSVSDILPKMTTTPNKLAERVKQILG
jgi:CheY-like chemotaxis protein